MTDENTGKPKRVQVNVSNQLPIWFIGWLFTIAYAKLSLLGSLLGLVLWPYFLGAALAPGA